MDAQLGERVAELDWYHTFDLPGGVVTPGLFDHRGVLDRYGLPEDLRGKRVLDVGTFDGFFAFELERRGAAEVVGIDIADRDALDFPVPLRSDPHGPGFHQRRVNFELVKEVTGARAQHLFCSAYDASPEALGLFDLVFVGSLLVHLRDPVRALMALRSVCADTLIVADGTHGWLDRLFPRVPLARFQAISPWQTWWIPNRRCLAHWIEAAGFTQVEMGASFDVPFRAQRGGIRHSVVRARAST